MCQLPVITSPFRWIAIDIVGPLEKSSAGYGLQGCPGGMWLCDSISRGFSIKKHHNPKGDQCSCPVVFQSRHSGRNPHGSRYKLCVTVDETASSSAGYQGLEDYAIPSPDGQIGRAVQPDPQVDAPQNLWKTQAEIGTNGCHSCWWNSWSLPLGEDRVYI